MPVQRLGFPGQLRLTHSARKPSFLADNSLYLWGFQKSIDWLLDYPASLELLRPGGGGIARNTHLKHLAGEERFHEVPYRQDPNVAEKIGPRTAVNADHAVHLDTR